MEKEVDIMTTNEMSRLSDWLEANGHNPEEIIDCIHYIAGSEHKPNKNKSGSPPLPTNEEPD